MPRSYSLAYLTAPSRSPPQALRLAAELGYEHVGIRILPSVPGGAFAPLLEDAALLKETKRAMADTGIGIFDVEIIRMGADFNVADQARFLDVCAALKARAVLVAGDDPEEARFSARFAQFCEAAAPFGISADLEFMPWTRVPDCRTALRVLTNINQPNAGILVDALHFARSVTCLTDIAAIPRQWLHYAQICDAPAEIPSSIDGLIHAARCERLLPGEGGIDLKGLFNTLPSDLPVSIEIPNEKRVAILGERNWSAQALAAARACCEVSGTPP